MCTNEMSSYEVVSLIFSGVSLLSIIILTISLLLSLHDSKQTKKSKAAETICYYIQSITDEISNSVSIVSTFSDDQCRDLYEHNKISVDIGTRNAICYKCPHRDECRLKDEKDKPCSCNQGNCEIQEDVSYIIREHIVKYLNILECVLLYWDLGIVDEKTIEAELSFLQHRDSVYRGLEVFRKLTSKDDNPYPALNKFYEKMDKIVKESQKP